MLAAELADRLAWFLRLRWAACAALAIVSAMGVVIASGGPWRALLALGAGIGTYNVACWWRLSRQPFARFSRLRAHALSQIGLDVAALLIAIHLTGGLASPLVPFLGFHMVIGAILLGPETMYLAAGVSSLSALGLHFIEARQAGLAGADPASAAALLAIVGFLFGTVYLTGSVSDRLKQRNGALRLMTDELRERSTELQRVIRELEELERRKSHYMRVSAHQLRSPLGTVRTTLGVIAGGYVDLASARGQRLIRGAADRVDGLILLVNGLLDLAKVREGRQHAPWTRNVNINQLLADLFDSLTPFSEERGVRLTPDVADVAVLDWGVPPDLVHAIENLIHNAIKYSLPGGEVIVQLRVSEDVAILRVRDQGIGVPEEFREQLFLEFMRAPNARTHAPEGTGLGLALVREVAEGHGGRVILEPSDGTGAVFRLELPLRIVPPAGAAAVTRQ